MTPNSAASAFLHLPADLLLAILLLLDVEDVLCLTQVCRGFHAFTVSSDYLWHQLVRLRPGLPLDLPAYVHASQLPAPVLQGATREALRLQHNWRRTSPRVREMRHIHEKASQTLLLGELLVVLRRNSLSVWRLATAVCVGSIDLPGSMAPMTFASSMQQNDILVAIISSIHSGTRLDIYNMQLSDETTFASASFRCVCSIERTGMDPFYEAHVYSNIVAVGIHSTLAPRILLIDTATGAQSMVDPQLPEASSNILVGSNRRWPAHCAHWPSQ
uniref:F-box domain-containing protein n=1 Tax=Mycena chlorophos TaxID=658473 RepID=A0ABQ0MBP6_MYCCL|nr:predicted protein [Mycena chlorophos]